MSFQQGLSGLNASSRNLDIIGHNIANASTVGFKAQQAQFADVFANSLYGVSALQQIGIGTQIADISQQFVQGNISYTNNALDLAISGDGFLRLSDAGAIVYSRNGQLKIDKDGYLVNSSGQNVTGYTQLTLDADNNVVSATGLGNLRINLADINPAATTGLGVVANLDASVAAPSLATLFDPTNSASYNFTTTVTVYDSLGTEHALNLYFRKDAAASNQWLLYGYLDGTAAANQLDLDGTTGAPVGPHTLNFNTDGSLVAATATVTNEPFAIAGANDLQIAMDFTGTSQYAGSSGVNDLTQDGYARGRLVGLSIDEGGVISGRYTNGNTRPLQQLLLATFRNPQALIPLGQNQWVASADTGSETINRPGEGVAGIVQSGAVEDSNVDLTAELVSLIVAQRLYQANAQTIRAQDQVLQTLVNLR